ncbi:MAG: VPLPA-CTERM sorting domain-containing protein [Hyphomicrobiales bacterium]
MNGLRLGLTAGALALVLSGSANAATISFNPSVAAFGNITAGVLATTQVDVLFSYANEGYIEASKADFAPLSSSLSNCSSSGCKLTIQLTPTLGAGNSQIAVFLRYSIFDPASVTRQSQIAKSISVSWNGVSAVPLPAALPLFATGIAALGVASRKRRNRVNAAA